MFEALSGYTYMLGRPSIARLELEAGITAVVGSAPPDSYPLLRPTFAQAFGRAGALRIFDATGNDTTEAVRARLGTKRLEAMMAEMSQELERRLLTGPDDDERKKLQADARYRPERSLAGQQTRVDYELATRAILEAHPATAHRIRDVVSGREFVHEWLDMFNSILLDRERAGEPSFPQMGAPGADSRDEPDALVRLSTAMPHHQVAVSIKTRYHRNPAHRWTRNDVVDIDAVSAAYAYCDAVYTDKAVRAALADSPELRVFGAYLPRRVSDITDWLDRLPTVADPEATVLHPIELALRLTRPDRAGCERTSCGETGTARFGPPAALSADAREILPARRSV